MGAGTLSRTARKAATVEIFRPAGWLRGSVLLGVALWVAVFFLLVSLKGSPAKSFLGTAFFITLFTLLAVFYFTLSIEVTGEAVRVHGLGGRRVVPFEDILRVDVKPGFLQTNYSILARHGPVLFNSLFSGHQRLLELVIERARLARN